MKKRILVLTALILAFSLCLQGCGLLTAAINKLLTTFPSRSGSARTIPAA